MRVRTLGLVFFLAFLLNLAWENAHQYLYIHYQGMAITESTLIRAALFDAGYTVVVAGIFMAIPWLRQRLWLMVLVGIAFAVGLEWFALSTNRWAYTSAMPIIPFINTGLTPTIQLGVLSWIAARVLLTHKSSMA